jgi:hypothetical protein
MRRAGSGGTRAASWRESSGGELPSAIGGITSAMGFFLKALAAIVAADAIDRHTRTRPRYRHPRSAAVPPPDFPLPCVGWDRGPQLGERGWKPEHAERP